MLNNEELKYKEYLKLQKRLEEVREKLSKLPNIKLDKPYQNGWLMFYDLRDDIKRRSDYPIIKECLDIGWCESSTKNINVVRAIRRGDYKALIKSRFGKMTLVSDFLPHRKDIPEDKYLKLNIKANKYFVLNTTSDRYLKYQRKDYYCSFPSYWLMLKVKPYIITHKYLKGGELESEYDCLRQRLYWSGEFNSFMTNYGKSYPASKDRTRIRSSIRKFINGDVDDIYNNKIPLEYTH